jgi:proteic killer suppression protein
MILKFRGRATEDIYHGIDSKAARSVPRPLLRVAVRKLDIINAAHGIQDLKVPPGNRLEMFKGDRKDWYSIRINEQYRIVFQWVDGNAKDIGIVDYH